MSSRRIRRIATGVALCIIALGAVDEVLSQEPLSPSVSDEELRSFAAVYVDVRYLQRELQSEIERILGESRLTEVRFNQIDELARRRGSAEDLPNVSGDELDEYRRVLDAFRATESDVKDRMLFALEDRGLTVERYNEIIVAAQQNPSMMKRAESYIDEERDERGES